MRLSFKPLKNCKGEMLIETLCAVIVFAMTMAFVATLLITSLNIIRESKMRTRSFIEQRNHAEQKLPGTDSQQSYITFSFNITTAEEDETDRSLVGSSSRTITTRIDSVPFGIEYFNYDD